MLNKVSKPLIALTISTAGIALVGYLGFRLVKILLERGGCIQKANAVATENLKDKKVEKSPTTIPVITEVKDDDKMDRVVKESLKIDTPEDKPVTPLVKENDPKEILKEVTAEETLVSTFRKKLKEPIKNKAELKFEHPKWIQEMAEIIANYNKDISIPVSENRELNAYLISYYSELINESKWDALKDVLHLYAYYANETSLNTLVDALEGADIDVMIEVSENLTNEDKLEFLAQWEDPDGFAAPVRKQTAVNVIRKHLQENNHEEAQVVLETNGDLFEDELANFNLVTNAFTHIEGIKISLAERGVTIDADYLVDHHIWFQKLSAQIKGNEALRACLQSDVFLYFQTCVDGGFLQRAADVINIHSVTEKLLNYIWDLDQRNQLIAALSTEDRLNILHTLAETDSIEDAQLKEVCAYLREYNDVDYLIGLAQKGCANEMCNRAQIVLADLEQTPKVIEIYKIIIKSKKTFDLAAMVIKDINSPVLRRGLAVELLKKILAAEPDATHYIAISECWKYLDHPDDQTFSIPIHQRIDAISKKTGLNLVLWF
jgi:hypothetical protein